MDSTFVWIILFAGGAIALLAVFLVASEKELKKKRLEIDQLLAKLGDGASVEGSADPAITAPNPELDQLRARNRELEQELAALANRLEPDVSASGELELAQRNVEIASANAQWLQNNNEELKAEIEELKARLAGTEDSRLRIPEIEGANAHTSENYQDKIDLENRITELESELSAIAARADEVQTLRDQLAESERVQQSMRDEQRGLEQEIGQLQARIKEIEEWNSEISALHEPFSSLLAKHSALQEWQRDYHETLAGFAQLIAKAKDRSTHGSGSNKFQTILPPTRAINNFSYEPQPAKVSPEQIIAAGESTEPSKRRVGALSLVIALALGGTLMVALWSMQGSDTPTANALSVARQIPVTSPAPIRVSPPEPIRSAPLNTEPVEEAKPAPGQARPAENDKPRRVKTVETARGQALTGTYEITRSTRVYTAPSELSQLMGDIEPGVRVNVVDSKDGWLEIHSKHGRPPGFIRKDAARVLARN